MRRAFGICLAIAVLAVWVPVLGQFIQAPGNRILDSHCVENTDSLSFSCSIAMHPEDSISYYTSVIVILDPNSAASGVIQFYRNSVLKRTLRLWPGGNTYDGMYCDRITVTKDLLADTTQIIGQW